MALESLKELALHELKDLYDAEHQILEALPQMAEAASSPQLKKAFNEHLQQTQGQVARLEQVFQQLGEQATRKHCMGVSGLIKEGQELIKKQADPDVKDAGLIAAAQKVEHYEMAGYGTGRTWARLLGMEEAANLLQQTLDEEGETDKKLTALAEGGVNEEAASGDLQAA